MLISKLTQVPGYSQVTNLPSRPHPPPTHKQLAPSTSSWGSLYTSNAHTNAQQSLPILLHNKPGTKVGRTHSLPTLQAASPIYYALMCILPFVLFSVWAGLSPHPHPKEEEILLSELGEAGPSRVTWYSPQPKLGLQIILETKVQPGDPLE